jgi:hypothetical protein
VASPPPSPPNDPSITAQIQKPIIFVVQVKDLVEFGPQKLCNEIIFMRLRCRYQNTPSFADIAPTTVEYTSKGNLKVSFPPNGNTRRIEHSLNLLRNELGLEKEVDIFPEAEFTRVVVSNVPTWSFMKESNHGPSDDCFFTEANYMEDLVNLNQQFFGQKNKSDCAIIMGPRLLGSAPRIKSKPSCFSLLLWDKSG